MILVKDANGLKRMQFHVRSGKNVFDGTRSSYTSAGITAVATSPYVTMNGTGTRDGRSILTKSQILPAGTYTIFIRQDGGNVIQNGGTRNNILFYLYKANNDTSVTWKYVAEMAMFFGSPALRNTFTLTEDTRIILTTYNVQENIFEDFVLAYNIVKGDGSNVSSVFDYEFEPYNASKKIKTTLRVNSSDVVIL